MLDFHAAWETLRKIKTRPRSLTAQLALHGRREDGLETGPSRLDVSVAAVSEAAAHLA